MSKATEETRAKRRRATKPPALLGLITVFTQGCAVPGPAASKDEVAAGVRPFSFQAAIGATPSCIAAISGGIEGAPRVVYVHGTPGNGRNWLDYVVKPEPGFESVAIDRPGFGDSAVGRAITSLRDQAAAIEPLLTEREGRWPILVGHSMGGPIVARVAAEHPDRVRAVVIVAGSLDPDLEKVLLIQRLGNFAFVPWMLPTWARHSNRELITLEDELRKLEPMLRDVRCPIVIVHGTRDRLVPYENVGFMLDRFAHNDRVELVRMEGENHFVIWTREEVIREAVRRADELAGSM